MPVRPEPFIKNSIYHVFNKTIDHRNIFNDKSYSDYFLGGLSYYRSNETQLSFSGLKKLEKNILYSLLKKNHDKKNFRVEVLAYTLMPTHFHLLIKQIKDDGISRYLSDSVNSLTRFFNLKNERKGPIFLPYFKSVRVTTEELLKHISRYIHLNPFSCNLVKNLIELRKYELSSYKSYIGKIRDPLTNNNDVMSLFNFNKARYKKFVEDQADYQKSLEVIKYAEKW